MIKADELIKKQKEKDSKKVLIFQKVYNIIEKKINQSSLRDNYYILYEFPAFIMGCSLYSIEECRIYIQNILSNNGFKTEYYSPNILLITWFPV